MTKCKIEGTPRYLQGRYFLSQAFIMLADNTGLTCIPFPTQIFPLFAILRLPCPIDGRKIKDESLMRVTSHTPFSEDETLDFTV